MWFWMRVGAEPHFNASFWDDILGSMIFCQLPFGVAVWFAARRHYGMSITTSILTALLGLGSWFSQF